LAQDPRPKTQDQSAIAAEELTMSANSKNASSRKSMGWMTVLILFGLVALFGGERWLVLLIPAATLVWFGAGSALRSGRSSSRN
jgi:hypothetical protein